MDWAVKKGIWPEQNREPIASVKVLFGTSTLPSAVILDVRSLSDRKSIKEIGRPTIKVEADDAKDNEKKNIKTTNKKRTKTKSSKRSSGSSKRSKSSGKKKKGSKKSYEPPKFPPPPDPSMWMDFKLLQQHIESYYLFFIPSRFPFRIRISDLEPPKYKQTDKGKSKPNKEEKSNNSEQYVKYSYNLKMTRNEPLYLFCDTMDTKLLILSILQTGCTKFLRKMPVEDAEEEGNIETDFLCNIRTCSAYASEVTDSEHSVEKPPYFSALTQFTLIDYNWMEHKLGKKILHDNTCGRTGKSLDIASGCFNTRSKEIQNNRILLLFL